MTARTVCEPADKAVTRHLQDHKQRKSHEIDHMADALQTSKEIGVQTVATQPQADRNDVIHSPTGNPAPSSHVSIPAATDKQSLSPRPDLGVLAFHLNAMKEMLEIPDAKLILINEQREREVSKLNNDVLSLETARRTERQEYQSQLTSLGTKCKSKAQELTIANRNLQEKLEELKRLQAAYGLLEKQIRTVENDNEKLRKDIVGIGNEGNVEHNEDFYIKRFVQLKADIDMWIVRNAGMPSELSKSSVTKFLQIFGSLGSHCKFSVDQLKHKETFRIWYKKDTSRVQMIRHIVAAVLLDQVFEQFVFGVAPEISDALQQINEDIMKHGIIFPLPRGNYFRVPTFFEESYDQSGNRAQRRAICTKTRHAKSYDAEIDCRPIQNAHDFAPPNSPGR